MLETFPTDAIINLVLILLLECFTLLTNRLSYLQRGFKSDMLLICFYSVIKYEGYLKFSNAALHTYSTQELLQCHLLLSC